MNLPHRHPSDRNSGCLSLVLIIFAVLLAFAVGVIVPVQYPIL